MGASDKKLAWIIGMLALSNLTMGAIYFQSREVEDLSSKVRRLELRQDMIGAFVPAAMMEIDPAHAKEWEAKWDKIMEQP